MNFAKRKRYRIDIFYVSFYAIIIVVIIDLEIKLKICKEHTANGIRKNKIEKEYYNCCSEIYINSYYINKKYIFL